MAESLAYVDEEHAHIAELAQDGGGAGRKRARLQRAALGRLLHTVQDFYAHTNYVALWVAERAGRETLDQPGEQAVAVDSDLAVDLASDVRGRASGNMATRGMATVGLEPQLLAHPNLQIAQWSTWREPFYYVPFFGKLLRRFWLPPTSHEALNLDCPRRGAHFNLAMGIARQRSLVEYARAVAAIRAVGGSAAVARFHGVADFVTQPTPAHV